MHYLHFRPLKLHILCQLELGSRVHILRKVEEEGVSLIPIQPSIGLELNKRC